MIDNWLLHHYTAGEGVGPQEYSLIKIKLQGVPASHKAAAKLAPIQVRIYLWDHPVRCYPLPLVAWMRWLSSCKHSASQFNRLNRRDLADFLAALSFCACRT